MTLSMIVQRLQTHGWRPDVSVSPKSVHHHDDFTHTESFLALISACAVHDVVLNPKGNGRGSELNNEPTGARARRAASFLAVHPRVSRTKRNTRVPSILYRSF